MSRYLAGLFVLLGGCASTSPTPYPTTYRVSGSQTELSGPAAEEAHRRSAEKAVFSGNARPFDQPLKLLRAPQPVMPTEDIKAGVTGRVVVEISFAESGAVESVRILESSKQSLAECVIAAVSRWAIAPATREGKPSKVIVRQPFNFDTAP